MAARQFRDAGAKEAQALDGVDAVACFFEGEVGVELIEDEGGLVADGLEVLRRETLSACGGEEVGEGFDGEVGESQFGFAGEQGKHVVSASRLQREVGRDSHSLFGHYPMSALSKVLQA